MGLPSRLASGLDNAGEARGDEVCYSTNPILALLTHGMVKPVKPWCAGIVSNACNMQYVSCYLVSSTEADPIPMPHEAPAANRDDRHCAQDPYQTQIRRLARSDNPSQEHSRAQGGKTHKQDCPSTRSTTIPGQSSRPRFHQIRPLWCCSGS